MDVQHVSIIGLASGLIGMAVGAVYYRRGGKGLMLLGAAIAVGPLAPLLNGRISEAAQIAISIASVTLSLSGVAVVVLETRARQRSIR